MVPGPFREDINERKAYYFDIFYDAYLITSPFVLECMEILKAECLTSEEKLNRIEVQKNLFDKRNSGYCQKYDPLIP